MLTSFSEVPHRPQDLHSMHCHGYFLTEMIILAVNCKQVGCPVTYKNHTTVQWEHWDDAWMKTVFWGNWPDLPQSAHDTSSSLCPVFLLFFSSPKQKSQYFPFLGGSPSLSKYQNTVELKASTHELKAFTLINTTVTQHEHKHLVSIRNQLKTS